MKTNTNNTPVMEKVIVPDMPNLNTEKNKKRSASKWSMRLKKLKLNEHLEKRYPYMFDPSHIVTLLVLACDENWNWKTISPFENQHYEHFLLPLTKNNSRSLKGENIDLFLNEKITNHAHLYFFLAGFNQECGDEKIKEFFDKSELINNVKTDRKKPALTPFENQGKAVLTASKTVVEFADPGNLCLMPLLELYFSEDQIRRSNVVEIKEQSFEIIFEFNYQ